MKKPAHALLALLLSAGAVTQEPQPSPFATERLVVQGRFVDEQGQPLARCDVKLSGHQSTGYAMSWRRTDWTNPPPVRTGADGRFRFELQLPAADEELDRGRYHLNVSHPRRVAWYSHCAFVVAQRKGGVDYGDVVLPEGHYPKIRVEDQKGRLQPGVLVRVRPVDKDAFRTRAPVDGPHSWLDNYGYRRTDIDGYVHMRTPLLAGSYTIEVPERDVQRKLEHLTLPDRSGRTVVVRAIPTERTIAGRVVDEDGAPVAGVRLRDGQKFSCYSRRDGRFTLTARSDAEYPTGSTRLEIAHNRRFDGWHPAGHFDWGTLDAEVKVPATALRSFVVRAADGSPVERFNLYCHPIEREAGRSPVRLSGTFANGRAAARLAEGSWRVLVAPLDGRNVNSGWQEIDVGAGEELPIDLPAPVVRTVQLRAADGTPVAGARVEVVVSGGIEPFGFVRPATSTRPPQGQPQRRTTRVAAARTDAQGLATLRLTEAGPCWLRISGAGVQRAVHRADLTKDRPVPIQTVQGATLAGAITPNDALLRLDPEHKPAPESGPSIYAYHSWSAPRVRLICGKGQAQRVVEGVLLDQSGRFSCAGLPPGPVEVHLHTYPRQDRTWLLGTFVLAAGDAKNVELELPADAKR